MEWNSTLYDKKHDFVAEYGKGLLEFVPRNDGQAILDLGCGTGVLTVQLAELCNKIVGVDSSRSMIDKAKEQFSSIEFMVCDALALPFENEFDVVFSNAVFHWISDHDALLKSIHKVLKPQGLLVCEFGASGNIAAIENAFTRACHALGYHYEPKFNFPAAEDFGKLLEWNGFVIDRIYDYDRPTVLKDGEQGLANWMKQFYASELSAMPENVQAAVCRKVEKLSRATLWNGEEWVADYRRLRVIAHI
ncbi:MAG: class I SAM-dependent methyltransferase [Clostridium sp.]|nr:class I SAM-dependent methyltransferase [Clostridium sp.]